MTSSAARNKPSPQQAVLSVCLDDSPMLGGLSRGVRDMAAGLGGRILSLDTGRLPPAADDSRWNLTRHRVGRGPLVSRHLRLTGALSRSLDAAIAESDLVICHSLYRAHLPVVRCACNRHGVPYWVVAHGMLDPWVVSKHPVWKRAWLMLYGSGCLADADRVIFNTEAERTKASPWSRPGNSLVIPWPVDLPDISDRVHCRADVRKRLGIPGDGRILLSLTRYDSLKRPLHTLAAFSAAHHPNWHLVMAGYDGDLTRSAVEREAHRSGGATIHVLGPVEGDDKRQLLVASDAFVSLSWRENFGYALAEAAAHGLCFAAAPDHDLTAAMPEQLRHWIAADHSLEEGTRVLRALLAAAPTIREDVGHTARSWAETSLCRKRFEMALREAAAQARVH